MASSQKRFLGFTLLFFSLSFLSAQDRCAYSEILQKDLQSNPHLSDRLSEMELQAQQWISDHSSILETRSSYTIPIVVHILWNTEAENISDEQIITQVELLNKDYSASNADLDKVPSLFKPLIASADIQFCLATTAPDGSDTNGITRTRTFVDSLGINEVYYTDGDGHDAWDSNRYLNIWVANLKNDAVGFGSSPGQKLPEEDGVVIDFQVFGLTNHPRLNLGRTLTHEVGHYLGLLHPWGNGLFNKDCDEDDNIADTPFQDKSYGGRCPDEESQLPESCGSTDMYMNFMNFTNDKCLHLFTKGQKLRMLAALLGPRQGLLNVKACQNIEQPNPEKGILSIGPNPTDGLIYISTFLETPSEITLHLFSISGQSIYAHQVSAADTYFSHLIDGTKWSTGTYLLVIEVGARREVYKVLIY